MGKTAYIVATAEGVSGSSTVAISLMSQECFTAFVELVMPDIRALYLHKSCDFDMERTKLFLLLQQGLYSAREPCVCSALRGVCGRCRLRHATQRRFVWRDCFDGVLPLEEGHWFQGWTDAAGEVSEARLPWLFCWRAIS